MSGYEDDAVEELRKRLRDYAHRAVACRTRKEFSELNVRIRLTTAHSLRLDHERIARELGKQLTRDLPGAQLFKIDYEVDLDTNPPELNVDIQPPPCPDREAQRWRDIPVSPGWLLLVLSFMDYEQPFHLAPVSGWIPLGRGVRSGPERVAVRIADDVRAVPKGPLLQIQRYEAWLQLVRTDVAPMYTVYVDSVVLDPGAITNLAAEGEITYLAHRSAATHLQYRVIRET